MNTLLAAPDSPAIKARAAALGLDVCGVTGAAPARHAAFYRQWTAEGKAGEMQWLAREPERRTDPRIVLPGARSLIVAGVNYWQPQPRGRGRIARYALGEDYHHLLLDKLESLAAEIVANGDKAKVYVDTGPVLEKPLAERAGIGWQGKSTMLIHKKLGPWLLLGEIITTLDLEPDAPQRDHCGACTRCIEACPTGAITGPYQLDARRCIAYLTIENKGSIPLEYRAAIGDRIYGCDDCLEACPWNRFAVATRENRFLMPPEVKSMSLRSLAAPSDDAFRSLFRRSPILRIKRNRFARNVCVALGNVGTEADLPVLQRLADDSDPLIAEHANWAIEEIKGRAS